MHNRLILFAGRLLFLLRRRRGRSGFGFLFTVGQVNVYLIFFLHIQNSIGLVLAVSRFGFRGVRHHYQRFAGAAVRGIAAIHILGRYIRGGGCRINGCGLPALAQQHCGNHNYHNGGCAKNGQQLLVFCTHLKTSLYGDFILKLW